ncbi:Dual specificity protein kinase YAK1 [Sesamum alatum]|uniref:Dual specificity protein kinase YAK1 n=1 Tax=Sesamum alatum TaxID=300844 RepID=A0AAE1YND9_9LAMI|nr:Dual specificity protein kinase YAK1 [Sesamum alatum]
MDEVCTGRREEESLPQESEASESSTSASSSSRLISWRPRALAFRPYSPILDTNAKPQLLRVVVRRPVDLILTVNYSLVNSDTKRRYIVKDILGHGTFGQVAKCWVAETNSFVAVKIIKNLPAYYQQALVEVSILTTLNKKFDPEDKHHIVRIYDYFVYQRHLCIAFELLETNLYELIKLNHFRGLSLSIVQLFSKQILRGLALMKDAGIIHCDLKPENILLCTSVKPAEIKIIDFGSACMEDRTVYSYIQSRYYRSPEVLLGYQYTTAIDMWSFGCIVAELFLGLPLFPGASEFDLLRRMIKILGQAEDQVPDMILVKLFEYFIMKIRMHVWLENAHVYIGYGRYHAKRWSPWQASKHPFVTGEPFTCPYKPVPETPHMPVSQNVKVDHHPAGGHWFAAGLSPNISGRNRGLMPNSPHYQLMSYVHPGPSGMNIYAQSGISILGNSPDTRRIMQLSHGNGIGFSPGNFAPMSLGSSPSQFTPPSSYSQISAGSPGQYGPPSPVRGNCHGSPLGKMASGSHYNRRKNWAFQGNFQSQETISSSSCQGHVADINTSCQSEGNTSVSFGSQSHRQPNTSTSTWRPQQGGRSITSGYSSSHMHTVQGSGYDKSEASNSLPDPGDWDPNYSEELLLQEDSSDMSSMTSEFMKGMHLSQPLVPSEPLIGVGISSRTSNASVSIQRHDGPVQSFPPGEAGSSPAIHGYAHMTNQSYFMPHSAQSSPSRLGQQPVQRHNLGRSAPFRDGEWSHLNVQAPQYSGGLRSPGSKDIHWGRRGNYSVSNAPPAFHGRKDYGRNG